jgi:NADH:ubiquinone oxidoreductase subunit K
MSKKVDRMQLIISVVMLSIAVGLGLGYLLYRRNGEIEKMKRNSLEALGAEFV